MALIERDYMQQGSGHQGQEPPAAGTDAGRGSGNDTPEWRRSTAIVTLAAWASFALLAVATFSQTTVTLGPVSILLAVPALVLCIILALAAREAQQADRAHVSTST